MTVQELQNPCAPDGIDPESGDEVFHPAVLHHGKCPDGFAAALCAWIHFRGAGDYVALSHDMPVPDVTGRQVYMLDIAFERDVKERVSQQAARLVVLDHHKSAADRLHGFNCRCGLVKFDLGKSAARMAWEYFNPGQEPPALIQHVEDRDLLRWMLEDSPAYLLALDAGPYQFNRWAGVMRMPPDAFDRFMERGRAMHTQFKKLAAEMASHAVPVTLNGEHGLLANAPYVFHTEVGQELAQRSGTFAAVWCMELTPSGQRVRIGLRAGPDYDTIPIAAAFGGGGHPNASAFRLPLERLPQLLRGDLGPESAA